MKMFLISDNEDTRIGMRLAGVEGVTVKNREEFEKHLSEVAEDKEISILLVTNPLTKTAGDIIDSFKLNNNSPLVVEIPGAAGRDGENDSITRYIREAIGLNI